MCKVSISPKLKEELLQAETSEDIDKIFENSKVISKEIRQSILEDIMNVTKTFYDCPKENEYEWAKEIFVTKEWRNFASREG